METLPPSRVHRASMGLYSAVRYPTSAWLHAPGVRSRAKKLTSPASPSTGYQNKSSSGILAPQADKSSSRASKSPAIPYFFIAAVSLRAPVRG